MAADHNKHIDPVTGVATTGHEWDGVRELNMPLPRWWLWMFYACILWAIGYWILFPAWPLISTNTQGLLNWNARQVLLHDMAALKAQRAAMTDRITAASFDDILADQQMLGFARAQGRAAFADNCAPCHGAGGGGAKGYPNLIDDDWLWGGKIDEIAFTITHGIRSTSDQTHAGSMPAFGRDKILERPDINAVADYVLSLSGLPTAKGADLARGKTVFAENCAVCHGDAGKGMQELGSANLTDAIWLYGSDRDIIIEAINQGRGNVMPAWGGRLDETTIKSLAVYVFTLGGGQK